MDMKEDNDRLLQQFFNETAPQQIADDGFTEQVMQQVASADIERPAFSVQRLSRLWTLFCLIAFGVWFMAFDGAGQLAIRLEVMLRTLAVQSFSINLAMMAAVLFGLLFVGAGEVIASETSRR